ncbi:MAG: allophanate hydrolase [Gammaproteobacteria bacterium]
MIGPGMLAPTMIFPSGLQTLAVSELQEGYRAKRFTVTQVMEKVLARIEAAPHRNVWIKRLDEARVMAYARALDAKPPESLPLYGVPFAIKDNIDLEGIATTAGCPDFAYTPGASATVVQRLIHAGAIPVGKTNLDQFATGLVGTRSPYGACMNASHPEFISGGSSSGSAVAVALGLVSFSLGTDTAGSGRIPAGFNNIIGLKPTCGRLSTTGVVPACRSIDCVSIFSLTADDAGRVAAVAGAYDAADVYSREQPESGVSTAGWSGSRQATTNPSTASGVDELLSAPAVAFRFGVPRADQLEFFGDAEYARLFGESLRKLEALGGERVEIDFAPFRAAARLLYDGAWIAERYVAVGEFIESKPLSVYPITLQLIAASRDLSAADAFRSQHRLMEAKRAATQAWGDIDVLVTPTAGTIYRIAEVDADPIRLNSTLGFYTNFVNFLDLAAVALPAGFRGDGVPFGITLVGQAWSDSQLLALADRVHRASVDRAGSRDVAIPEGGDPAWREAAEAVSAKHVQEPKAAPERISVAVCGAHLEGLPLNHQLTSRGAALVRRARTAPSYRFYALPGGPPFRPGLIRVAEGGAPIDVEVWSVPSDQFGSFVAGIPAPLGIGKVDLEDGERVSGFICETQGVEGAEDITALGSWRAYLKSKAPV